MPEGNDIAGEDEANGEANS